MIQRQSSKRKASEYFQQSSFDVDAVKEVPPAVALPPTKVSQSNVLKSLVREQLASVISRTETNREDWSRSENAIGLKFDEKFSLLNNDNKKQHTTTNRAHLIRLINDEQQYSISSAANAEDAQLTDKMHEDAIFANNYHRNNNLTDVPQVMNSDEQSSEKVNTYTPNSKFGKFLLGKGDNNNVANDDASLPLYKRIKAKTRVMAKYINDGRFYPATVKAVMHGGYTSAQYDIVFDNTSDNKVYTISWSDVESVCCDGYPKLSETASLLIAPTLSMTHTGGPTGVLCGSGGSNALQPTHLHNHHHHHVVQQQLIASSSVSSLASSTTTGGGQIRSIRFDSATGQTIVNEGHAGSVAGGNSSNSSNTVSPSGHHIKVNIEPIQRESSSTTTAHINQAANNINMMPIFVKTVESAANNNHMAVVAPSAVAVTKQSSPHISSIASSTTQPTGTAVVNPNLLLRSKGGWKAAKK